MQAARESEREREQQRAKPNRDGERDAVCHTKSCARARVVNGKQKRVKRPEVCAYEKPMEAARERDKERGSSRERNRAETETSNDREPARETRSVKQKQVPRPELYYLNTKTS